MERERLEPLFIIHYLVRHPDGSVVSNGMSIPHEIMSGVPPENHAGGVFGPACNPKQFIDGLRHRGTDNLGDHKRELVECPKCRVTEIYQCHRHQHLENLGYASEEERPPCCQ